MTLFTLEEAMAAIVFFNKLDASNIEKITLTPEEWDADSITKYVVEIEFHNQPDFQVLNKEFPGWHYLNDNEVEL